MTHAEIEAFLTICEQKNITRAAEMLYIGQSALSTRLKTLEREVGCQLLVRGKGLREIELTREGERFFKLALQYREIMENMQKVGCGQMQKALRVSTINSLGTYLFPQVYDRFLEASAGIELMIQDMRYPEAAESVERGLTDLAFVTDSMKNPAIEITPVFSEEMVFVCAADSPYPEVVSLSMLDVKKEVCCNWCEIFAGWHGEYFGRKSAPSLVLEMMNQMEFFLAKSESWAVVPPTVAQGFLSGERIRQCQTDFPMPERVTYCLSRSGGRETAEGRRFLSCLKEVLQQFDQEKIHILI